jgi:hypothetical protein
MQEVRKQRRLDRKEDNRDQPIDVDLPVVIDMEFEEAKNVQSPETNIPSIGEGLLLRNSPRPSGEELEDAQRNTIPLELDELHKASDLEIAEGKRCADLFAKGYSYRYLTPAEMSVSLTNKMPKETRRLLEQLSEKAGDLTWADEEKQTLAKKANLSEFSTRMGRPIGLAGVAQE